MRSSPLIASAGLADPPSVNKSYSDEEASSTLCSSETEFHVTGFQRFFNVPINPTELIVQALPDYLRHHPLKPSAHVASMTVLKVSAETTTQRLVDIYAHHAKSTQTQLLHRKRPPLHRTIFLHLGVNMRADKFYLETHARNEATFSCPDEMGWTPIRHAIDPDNSDIAVTRQTTLDAQTLLKNLTSLGYPVDISRDAGRFVCNWVYFNSLKLSGTHCTHALFVHVPPASVIHIDRQIQFVASVLDCIARLP